MKYTFVVLTILTFLFIGKTHAQTKSQVEFCKTEVEQLERKVDNLNKLMQAQSTEVFDLKKKIIELRQENQNLEEENKQLNEVAINMLNIAIKFEQQDKIEEALEVYKLLIKSYPSSLEAVASRIQIKDLRKSIKK